MASLVRGPGLARTHGIGGLCAACHVLCEAPRTLIYALP